MTGEVTTFPETWRLALSGVAQITPAISGPTIVLADVTTLHAVDRATGAPAWQHRFNSDVDGVVASGTGCIVSIAEPKGHRVMKIDAGGRIAWELDGRWNVTQHGLAAAGDRFLLSAARSASPDDIRLWEMRTADGSTIRSIPGWARATPVAIAGGWAWVDADGARLRVLDDAGDRDLANQVRLVAVAGSLVLGDSDGWIRAFDPSRGLVWERPGGASRTLAADERSVACARRVGTNTWLCCYDLAGTELWEVGPFPSSSPSLRFWGDVLVASGVRWGTRRGVILLDRVTGGVLARESGSWSSVDGGMPVDDAALFAISAAPQIARREQRRWPRSEDAWDPAYLIAVAAQLDWWLLRDKKDPSFKRLKEILDGINKTGKAGPFVDEVRISDGFDASELRDLVAAIRSARRSGADRLKEGLKWLACTASWPLERTDLVEDLPHRRVELFSFDDRRDDPQWEERARIAGYAQLRSLVLRLMGLDGGPLGIELGALPCLEYLDLGENVLRRVPPEVRDCKQLVYLNLRKNDLESIEPDELPPALLRLDVGQNKLKPASIERLRAALPACSIEIY